MSTVSFNSNNQGIQDLLAALPAPASSTADRSRNEDFGEDARPGFNELLRDSAQSQEPASRAEQNDAIDTPARGESEQDDQAVADQVDDVDQGTQTSDTQEESGQDTPENTGAQESTDQATTSEAADQGQASSNEAQLQAAANAAAAQLNVVAAVTQNQPTTQAQAVSIQQVDLGQVQQVAASEGAAVQNQANASNLSLNAALPTQAQTANGQAAQTDVAATVQPVLLQGNTGQTNSGDTGGESRATTETTANTAAASSSNAAATATFSVSDQVSSEARLSVNPTGGTQTADTARQAQTQVVVGNASNDSLNTARLTRGLANAVQQRGGAVTLRLTPPEIGTVRIQLQITGTNVNASFHAESASAQTLLTNQLAQLR